MALDCYARSLVTWGVLSACQPWAFARSTGSVLPCMGLGVIVTREADQVL
ncbi:hypothetical protein HETIRDRAFT_331072 [Heterobasidion irregulare TC 32-1]|uniref:Uncharacterized protein n=1 Tax=Heterobasidion irregulare (strain TC 32-1) TaxID=747525 RepID=W4JPE8_HETIT|nr:uncharacterized protein HETIRDRAFT_331072 [Heterobasidion irregulare TC 32-1]ETW75339.1 hypothetical protein HETIRDRAFT_331072 [Heterobasidion irregulare TC 32-1]